MPSGTAATAPRRSPAGARSPPSFVRCERWLRHTKVTHRLESLDRVLDVLVTEVGL
jgi:hypothetical protein